MSDSTRGNGWEVTSQYGFPAASSKHILEDQHYLIQRYKPIFEEMGVKLEEQFKTVQEFAQFMDTKGFEVTRQYIEGRFETDIIWNEELQRNEYHEIAKEFMRDYGKNGYAGLFAREEFGGKGISKVFMGGISFAGFNTAPSQYLLEMVMQGDINLLTAAYDDEKNPTNKTFLSNVIKQIVARDAFASMVLTGEATGANLGKNLSSTAVFAEDGSVTIKGGNKYITAGLITGGLDEIGNSYAVIVSATEQKGQKSDKSTVSLIPLYKVDEKTGKLLRDNQGNKILNEGIKVSRWTEKPGIRGQILLEIEYDNVKAIPLTAPEKGWPLMFKVMDTARVEVGAQAVGHLYDYITCLEHHTTLRGIEANDQIAIAERDQAAIKLNKLKGFVQTAAGVIMQAGVNFELANLKDVPEALKEEQAKARDMVVVEAPMIKAYFTYKAKELAIDAQQLLGTDGYISKRIEQIGNDLYPTPIYEGPNEMMAKQIIITQIDKMPTFIEQTRNILNSLDKNQNLLGKDRERTDKVQTALKELQKCSIWASAQNQQIKVLAEENESRLSDKEKGIKKWITTGNSHDDKQKAQEMTKELLAASEDFLKLFGAVYMGREAARTMDEISKQHNFGDKPLAKTEIDNLDSKKREAYGRYNLARNTIHEFVDYKTLEKMIDNKDFTVAPENLLAVMDEIRRKGVAEYLNGVNLVVHTGHMQRHG